MIAFYNQIITSIPNTSQILPMPPARTGTPEFCYIVMVHGGILCGFKIGSNPVSWDYSAGTGDVIKIYGYFNIAKFRFKHDPDTCDADMAIIYFKKENDAEVITGTFEIGNKVMIWVWKNDEVVGEAGTINFKEGSNITLTVNKATNDNQVDVTIAATGGSGTPGDTVEDETSFDIEPDAGASDEYSRADHIHGTPATPAGAGDMTKATYDTDNDGKVDKAEAIDDGTYSASAADIKDAVDKKHSNTTDHTQNTDTKILVANTEVNIVDSGSGVITLKVDGADQVKQTDGKLAPNTDNDIDVGDSTHRVKDLYVAGNISDGTDAASVSEIEDAVDLKHANTNDPSSDQKAALVGTSGTPSVSNKYVTNDDSRNTDARTPAAHNQAANTITSGTLDGDRLPAMSTTKLGGVPATGAPASKYLRDDATWQTIAGGGDMLKSTYDTGANNIVDKAETVDDGAGNSKTALQIKTAVDYLDQEVKTTSIPHFLKLDIGAASSITQGALSIDGNVLIYDNSSLGSQKLQNQNFTTVPDNKWTWGTGWSHDTTNHEADHTPGYTNALEQDISAVAGEIYKFSFTVLNRTVGSVVAEAGNTTVTTADVNDQYVFFIVATGTGNLKFTPSSNFDGSIDSVSIKKVNAGDLRIAGSLYSQLGEFENKVNKGTASGYASLDANTLVVEAIGRIVASAAALTATEGYCEWGSTRKLLKLYDGQRERGLSPIGWQPYAYPLTHNVSTAMTTTLSLPAAGGSVAVPIKIEASMLLQSVTVRHNGSGTERTWGWDLYEQYLNNGNAGENTLTRVAASDGNQTFTGVVDFVTLNVASAPVYLAPGIYWLIVQNRHATSTFALGSGAVAASTARNSGQTKTTTNPNGSTVDFVAITWTAITASIGVCVNGRVFGQTTAF